MQRTYVSDLKTGKEVLLKGWVYEIRSLAKLKFLLLRDMTGMVQCVVNDKKLIDKTKDLSLESVIEIKGRVKKANVKAENVRGDVEIEVSSFEVLNKAEELPMQVNEKAVSAGLDLKLDWRSLSLRTTKSKAIFRIQGKLIEGMQEYLNKEGFLQVFDHLVDGLSKKDIQIFFTDKPVVDYKTSKNANAKKFQKLLVVLPRYNRGCIESC